MPIELFILILDLIFLIISPFPCHALDDTVLSYSNCTLSLRQDTILPELIVKAQSVRIFWTSMILIRRLYLIFGCYKYKASYS